jgi:hypothetical protein
MAGARLLLMLQHQADIGLMLLMMVLPLMFLVVLMMMRMLASGWCYGWLAVGDAVGTWRAHGRN